MTVQPADIVSPGGVPIRDGVVNVSDLLYVINSWGACNSLFPAPPESVEDCERECDAEFPGYGPDYAGCVEKCVQALCEAQILPPQDCP